MKTIVKIDPEREYNSAKAAIGSLSEIVLKNEALSQLDGSVDNLKTVINVLIERLTPKKRKEPKKKPKKSSKLDKDVERDFKKLPSEKFPNLLVKENIATAERPPLCPCCQKVMSESGIYKTSEKLEVIPKQYYIVRNKRVVYNCASCKEGLVNAPAVPSISPTSNYGDSIIMDSSLSKYCDLIPMERYAAMAEREGLPGLPPNSLISLSHQLADFFKNVYDLIKKEVLTSKIIYADETPHKMLEGDKTKNWYLWGFFAQSACFFEAHGTRSGDVPLNFFMESMALYFLTDGYSGYKRAISILRATGREVYEVYCNAHAYRYFRDASDTWQKECQIFLKIYGDIYELERLANTSEQLKEARTKMAPLFSQIKAECEKAKENIMPNSSLEKAIHYFLNHYSGLTECVNNIELPLDNNFSERALRSSVVGRKTWYGTHSKRGAETNAILFTIVESCKINKINPRNYFTWLTDRIHTQEQVLTPHQYASQIDSG